MDLKVLTVFLAFVTFVYASGGVEIDENYLEVKAKAGEPVQLRCEAKGDLPITFEWKLEGEVIDLGKDRRYDVTEELSAKMATSILHIASADSIDNKMFSCAAANEGGSDDIFFQIKVDLEAEDCTLKMRWCDCLEARGNCAWCRQIGFNDEESRCGGSKEDLIGKGCGAAEIITSKAYIHAGCKGQGSSELCNGRGQCNCGRCDCFKRQNQDEVVSGLYCECDNFSCDRNNGRLCSGNGKCECGQCMCRPGWEGSACSVKTGSSQAELCSPSTSTCTEPGTGKLCGDQGHCVCGACRCSEGYTGKYCEECLNCESSKCVMYNPCIVCRLKLAGNTFTELDCQTYCNFFTLEGVKEAKVENNHESFCVIQELNQCPLLYVYGRGNVRWSRDDCRSQSAQSQTAVDCPESTKTCRHSDTEAVCSDSGKCVCGTCECIPGYTGKFCEDCSNCERKCPYYKPCIQCKIFKMGPYEDETVCQERCGYFTLHQVNEVSPNPLERMCVISDEDNCTMTFLYGYDKQRDEYYVKARPTRDGHSPKCLSAIAPSNTLEKQMVPPVCSPEDRVSCSGHGKCLNGTCHCYEGRLGKACEDCTSCGNKCERLKSCVQCKVRGGKCEVGCDFYNIVAVTKDEFAMARPNQNRCVFVNETTMEKLAFSYTYDENGEPFIRVESENGFPNAMVDEGKAATEPDVTHQQTDTVDVPSPNNVSPPEKVEPAVKETSAGIHLIPSLIMLLCLNLALLSFYFSH